MSNESASHGGGGDDEPNSPSSSSSSSSGSSLHPTNFLNVFKVVDEIKKFTHRLGSKKKAKSEGGNGDELKELNELAEATEREGSLHSFQMHMSSAALEEQRIQLSGQLLKSLDSRYFEDGFDPVRDTFSRLGDDFAASLEDDTKRLGLMKAVIDKKFKSEVMKNSETFVSGMHVIGQIGKELKDSLGMVQRSRTALTSVHQELSIKILATVQRQRQKARILSLMNTLREINSLQKDGQTMLALIKKGELIAAVDLYQPGMDRLAHSFFKKFTALDGVRNRFGKGLDNLHREIRASLLVVFKRWDAKKAANIIGALLGLGEISQLTDLCKQTPYTAIDHSAAEALLPFISKEEAISTEEARKIAWKDLSAKMEKDRCRAAFLVVWAALCDHLYAYEKFAELLQDSYEQQVKREEEPKDASPPSPSNRPASSSSAADIVNRPRSESTQLHENQSALLSLTRAFNEQRSRVWTKVSEKVSTLLNSVYLTQSVTDISDFLRIINAGSNLATLGERFSKIHSADQLRGSLYRKSREFIRSVHKDAMENLNYVMENDEWKRVEIPNFLKYQSLPFTIMEESEKRNTIHALKAKAQAERNAVDSATASFTFPATERLVTDQLTDEESSALHEQFLRGENPFFTAQERHEEQERLRLEAKRKEEREKKQNAQQTTSGGRQISAQPGRSSSGSNTVNSNTSVTQPKNEMLNSGPSGSISSSAVVSTTGTRARRSSSVETGINTTGGLQSTPTASSVLTAASFTEEKDRYEDFFPLLAAGSQEAMDRSRLVLTKSSLQACRYILKYISLMESVPSLSVELLSGIQEIFELYFYNVFCTFGFAAHVFFSNALEQYPFITRTVQTIKNRIECGMFGADAFKDQIIKGAVLVLPNAPLATFASAASVGQREAITMERVIAATPKKEDDAANAFLNVVSDFGEALTRGIQRVASANDLRHTHPILCTAGARLPLSEQHIESLFGLAFRLTATETLNIFKMLFTESAETLRSILANKRDDSNASMSSLSASPTASTSAPSSVSSSTPSPSSAASSDGQHARSVDHLLNYSEKLSAEFRHYMYRNAAPMILPIDSFNTELKVPRFDLTKNSNKPNYYVDAILRQFEESDEILKDVRKIRMQLPKEVLHVLYTETIAYLMETLVKFYASVKKCTPEGRGLMGVDLMALRSGIERLTGLRPPPNWDYVVNYVSAFYFQEEQFNNFLMEHTEYSLEEMDAVAHVGPAAAMKSKQREKFLDHLQLIYNKAQEIKTKEKRAKESAFIIPHFSPSISAPIRRAQTAGSSLQISANPITEPRSAGNPSGTLTNPASGAVAGMKPSRSSGAISAMGNTPAASPANITVTAPPGTTGAAANGGASAAGGMNGRPRVVRPGPPTAPANSATATGGASAASQGQSARGAANPSPIAAASTGGAPARAPSAGTPQNRTAPASSQPRTGAVAVTGAARPPSGGAAQPNGAQRPPTAQRPATQSTPRTTETH